MGTQSTWEFSVWLQYHGSGVRGTELLNISSFLDPRDLFFSCYPRNLIIFSDILVKMDWVTVAIGLGVCVITAMGLYLISVYSFKEHTFASISSTAKVFRQSVERRQSQYQREREET